MITLDLIAVVLKLLGRVKAVFVLQTNFETNSQAKECHSNEFVLETGLKDCLTSMTIMFKHTC